MQSEASPGKSTRPYVNITRAKRSRHVTQVVERLPCKCETPKFKPQYYQKSEEGSCDHEDQTRGKALGHMDIDI